MDEERQRIHSLYLLGGDPESSRSGQRVPLNVESYVRLRKTYTNDDGPKYKQEDNK